MPFFFFRSPRDIWDKSPSFLLHEYLIYIFIGRILKSCRSKKDRGILLAYLVGGFVIESLTQAYPDIDNFWHDQGVISYYSISKPLYIMMMYIWSYGVPCLLSRAFQFNILSESAFVWLATISLYGIYDTYGVTHLWWLWHQTDHLFINRFAGVPTMSTWWSGVHGVSINLAIRAFEHYFPNAQNTSSQLALTSFLSGVFGSTVIMFIMFSPYHIIAFFGASAIQILGTTALFCVSILVYYPCTKPRLNEYQQLMSIWILIYVGFMISCAFIFSSINVQRTHVAQEFGPCETLEMIYGDATGRYRYACLRRNVGDYFDMTRNPYINDTSVGERTYTVNGRPKSNEFWMALFYHAAVLIFIMTFMSGAFKTSL